MAGKKGYDYLKDRANVVKFARGRAPEIQLFQLPGDVKKQNELGRDLVEWARVETNNIIQQFANERHISLSKLLKLAQKNEYFGECLEIAKETICARHEQRLLDDRVYNHKMLNALNPILIEAEERKAAAKVQAAVETSYKIQKEEVRLTIKDT
jgi:cytidylate kinase